MIPWSIYRLHGICHVRIAVLPVRAEVEDYCRKQRRIQEHLLRHREDAGIVTAGGVKTLILMANIPDRVLNVSTCGDNCAKWILKIVENRKMTINLRHLMNFGKEKFDIKNDSMHISCICIEYTESGLFIRNIPEKVLQKIKGISFQNRE